MSRGSATAPENVRTRLPEEGGRGLVIGGRGLGLSGRGLRDGECGGDFVWNCEVRVLRPSLHSTLVM